jgi:hypothetical protein
LVIWALRESISSWRAVPDGKEVEEDAMVVLFLRGER